MPRYFQKLFAVLKVKWESSKLDRSKVTTYTVMPVIVIVVSCLCVYQKHIETTSQIIVLVCSGSSTEIHHVAEYGMSYYHAQHELVLTFSRMRQRAHVLVYLRSNLFINCRCSWWFMVSFGILQCFPINCMSHHTNSKYNPHALPADRLNGSWFNDDAS